MVKKDVEINKTRTELTKPQAYLTENVMKEEELVCEAAKEKEEVLSMRNARGQYTT